MSDINWLNLDLMILCYILQLFILQANLKNADSGFQNDGTYMYFSKLFTALKLQYCVQKKTSGFKKQLLT